MGIDAGDALVRAVHDHNPWWDAGTTAFSLPARHKSDFYHLARPDEAGSQLEEQPLMGLVGRRGVGKTTLLHQFVHHRLESGDPPERFLYLPFDHDPLYQLQSDDQLRRAVRYWESRVLGRLETQEPQFLLFDDIHRIEHPTKARIDGWGVPVADLLDTAAERYVVVTASAGVQVERELADVGVDSSAYDTQPILPEKFRDYIFELYPDLEETQEARMSPTSLRRGPGSLPRALETGDVDPFLDELLGKYEQVAHAAGKIKSQVVDYLAMGGTLSFAQEGVVESAAALDTSEYRRLRADVRDALYQDVPGFESIQTIADLERLLAIAARNRGAEPLRYQALVELFDVDRRTIAESYLPALAELYLVSGVTEYDNSRPRSVRLYLRDTGVVQGLREGDARTVRDDIEYEADLARLAGFDHSMRFSYNIDAVQGHDRPPSVQFWQGEDGEVDFVFEVDGTPVPVGFAYRSRSRAEAVAGVREFMDEYGATVGMVVVGDMVEGGSAITGLDEDIVQMPFWFYLFIA